MSPAIITRARTTGAPSATGTPKGTPSDHRVGDTQKALGDGFDASARAAAPRAVVDFHARQGIPRELFAEKLERMSANATDYFRMNPAQFHADMSGRYAPMSALFSREAPKTLINGDPHLGNFGVVRGADGAPVWGLNDFDQAQLGSPERDVERLAVGVVLAARERGMNPSHQRELVEATADAYFNAVRTAKAGRQPAALTAKEARGEVRQLLRDLNPKRVARNAAQLVDLRRGAEPRLRRSSDVVDVSEREQHRVSHSLRLWAKQLPDDAGVKLPLRVLDVAEKLGSGGSTFGLPRYYALVEGADSPVVLELKALIPTNARKAPDAEAVVEASKLQGGQFNPLAGATVLDGRAMLVREREPEKASLEFESLSFHDLKSVVEQAATVLARAHTQEPRIADALKKWIGNDERIGTNRLVELAETYAAQTELDQRGLRAALK